MASAISSTLTAAAASIESGNTGTACNQVDAFINKVKAQSGKKLTTAEAEQLLSSAIALKASMECT
ncbi:MAG: hypothetical protein NFCOHLIN_01091 [Gammaproteobacteria bacterium]|nr:hypothetical protein [Gammaproteobacteria bacterium]